MYDKPVVSDEQLDAAREDHACLLQGLGDALATLLDAGHPTSAEWVREAIRRLK